MLGQSIEKDRCLYSFIIKFKDMGCSSSKAVQSTYSKQQLVNLGIHVIGTSTSPLFRIYHFALAATFSKHGSDKCNASVHSDSSRSTSLNSSTRTQTPHNSQRSLQRFDSEGSCLQRLKETIVRDGDLAKTVVRMEVSQREIFPYSIITK